MSCLIIGFLMQPPADVTFGSYFHEQESRWLQAMLVTFIRDTSLSFLQVSLKPFYIFNLTNYYNDISCRKLILRGYLNICSILSFYGNNI